MTYGELKANLNYLLAGDTALRNDSAAVAAFYKKAMNTILRSAEPLTLIKCARERFKPERSLDSVYFIRKPEIPANDTDAIDLDESLQDALLNYIAAYMVRNSPDGQRKQFYEREANSTIDKNIFDSSQYMQDIKFYNIPYGPLSYTPTVERRDIPPRLDAAGLLKYYIPVKDLDAWRYDWHEPTIDKLDAFMLHRDGRVLSPSETVLWDQLCAWEDAEISNDPETKALAELDRILLQRGGAVQ